MDYTFPGNVRELRNIVIRLTTKYAGESVNSEQLLAELDPEQGQDVRPSRRAEHGPARRGRGRKAPAADAEDFSLDETLQQMERSYVEAALALTNGNLSQAAKLLGIHRTTLYSRMQNYMPRPRHATPPLTTER